MSPFKVIRCRYYADDGTAISPYCSAGRRCTFLHPGDKGWPGGDPVPETTKRQDEWARSSEWPRLRALKSSDRSNLQSQKASMSRSGGAGEPSMIDLVSEVSVPSTRRDGNTSKDQPPVFSIIKTFHDIAKFQTKITQDREKLDRAIDKLAAFRELSESLSKVSTASAAAVNPTLDAIIKNRHELEVRLEEDTRQLSNLWDDVLNVLFRAICRQFDSELKAGTDFLRQEARMLMKSFPKTVDLLHNSTASAPDSPPSRSAIGGSDERMNMGNNTSGTLKEEEESVNPPIGLSDNGWGRKRRRVSLDNAEDGTGCADSAAHVNLRGMITRMQQQLDEQGDKIISLIEQNQALQQANKPSSNTNQPADKNGVHSLLSSPSQSITPHLSEDLLSHIRRTLQSDILTFISPALENQKQVYEYWEMRLKALAEELKNFGMVNSNSRNGLEEDGTVEVK